MDQQPLKLYMILLGSKAPGRHVEQHDFFFGIGTSLAALVPEMRAFWRNTSANLHIDAYREVSHVDGYKIEVVSKNEVIPESPQKLFFINLGGYIAGRMEEQHYVILSVKTDRGKAVQDAKKAPFFQTNTIANAKEANAHIDDKYGIDVDDIYAIPEMLSAKQKAKYQIKLTPMAGLPEDEIHLGYFPLAKLE